MKRLHTLMLFLAVLFTGFNFNAEAATVKQALSCNPEAWAEQPGACPTTYAYFHERRSLNNFHRDRVITFEQIAE